MCCVTRWKVSFQTISKTSESNLQANLCPKTRTGFHLQAAHYLTHTEKISDRISLKHLSNSLPHSSFSGENTAPESVNVILSQLAWSCSLTRSRTSLLNLCLLFQKLSHLSRGPRWQSNAASAKICLIYWKNNSKYRFCHYKGCIQPNNF